MIYGGESQTEYILASKKNFCKKRKAKGKCAGAIYVCGSHLCVREPSMCAGAIYVCGSHLGIRAAFRRAGDIRRAGGI
jgi:hypothetical protein